MVRRPRAPSPPASAKIEDLRHPADVTRRNIPTAETELLMAQEEAAPAAKLYPRNPDLDPQLVWHGKDELDAVPLRVPTVPIYIQEKVLPAALIRDLRRVSKGCEPQADLFGGFDRISDPEMRMEFYQHAENWSNRMILGDSLLVMNSLAEKEGLRGQVQCIYFDPPYGIRFASNWHPSTRTREVKEGRVEGVSLEPEVVAAFRDTWKDGIYSYLSYLRDRLVVARELLTESGSVFVQIGDENVHRVRALMDEVFGDENFVSLITVRKTGGTTGKFLSGTADYIIWYARNTEVTKYRPLLTPKEGEGNEASFYDLIELADGTRRRMTDPERSMDSDELQGKRFQLTILTSPRVREARTGYFPVVFENETYLPTAGEWKTYREGIDRLTRAKRVERAGSTLRYVRYLADFPASEITNTWTNVGGATGPIYVVQTNPELVKRCVMMTTDPGDLVLDPTCGSGTTASVAEQWGRRWITIDTSRVALALARTRLAAARHPAYLLRDSEEGSDKEAALTGYPSSDGPFTADIRQGFVLERVPHVMLKSIANNAEIDIIHAKWQPELDKARTALNHALGTAHAEWQVPHETPPPNPLPQGEGENLIPAPVMPDSLPLPESPVVRFCASPDSWHRRSGHGPTHRDHAA